MEGDWYWLVMIAGFLVYVVFKPVNDRGLAAKAPPPSVRTEVKIEVELRDENPIDSIINDPHRSN